MLYNYQENGTCDFFTYYVWDLNILIAFRTNASLFHLNLFDDKLQIINTFSFHMELNEIRMNNDEIFLMASNNKHLVYVYDYKFTLKTSFGQNKHKKKPFYLNKQVLDIDNDKIYVKDGLNLILVSRLNGVCLKTISLTFEIYQFYLDTNNSRFIIVNKKSNTLSLMDIDGNVLIENQLESEVFNQFDRFKFTKSGHFCFVNAKTYKMLII